MLAFQLAAVCALAMPRSVVELPAFKAHMLIKSWAGRTENANLVRIVPDGKKLKAVRALQGDEIERRKVCTKQFAMVSSATYSLAAADKSEYPSAKRQLIPELKIGGAPRGEKTKVFASLPGASSGGGASTLSLVEARDKAWSILALCVSPDEKALPKIVEAEAATLNALQMEAEAAAPLRCTHLSRPRSPAAGKPRPRTDVW